MATFPTGGTQFSLAQSLAQLSLTAARPNFELQFSIAQNAAIDRLNEEIKEFQESDFGKAKTVLLDLKKKRLQKTLEVARGVDEIVTANQQLLKEQITLLGELRDLASSTTVTEFDAKRDALLLSLDKLRAAFSNPFGAPEGLAGARDGSIAAIEAIVHNNFASAADVTAAQDAIDAVTADLEAAKTLVDINEDILDTTIRSADRVLGEVDLEVDRIRSQERREGIERIKALEEETARVLSVLSLSFEGLQGLTQFVTQQTLFQAEPEPGSVLNLFT